MGYINEARLFFNIPQKAKVQVGGTSIKVFVGSLTRKTFKIEISKNKLLFDPTQELRVGAWHEVAHIRNLLNRQPVFRFEPSNLFNSIVIDDTLNEKAMNDLKGLDEEAIFATVIVSNILSDKFVFDVLSKTPVKDDVIACQFSMIKQLLSGWHKSKKTLNDAWTRLDIMPLGFIISEYPSKTGKTASLEKLVKEYEHEVLTTCLEPIHGYAEYKATFLNSSFTSDNEQYYNMLINLTKLMPLHYLIELISRGI